jgi:serine/threonine protein kinase
VVKSAAPAELETQPELLPDGVPEKAEREDTAPVTREFARGTTHADLKLLAEGRRGPVTLAGRYRLFGTLGSGGMATVFRGELISLGRPVAVKILDDERGHRHGGFARFLGEGRLTAKLRHPNVIDVLDFGSTTEGVVYLVMELLEGEDLRAKLRREGPLSWSSVRSAMLGVCAGLTAAHEAGVIHRDLKPANCFCEGDAVKLLDFGIATELSPAERDEQRLTEEGRVVGTPEYMSPEQARGEEVDGRSDVYAAGLILGELLTGNLPFLGKSAAAVIAAQIYEPPPTLRALSGGKLEFDPAIEAIYARAVSKKPEERFESAQALAEAIAAVDSARCESRPIMGWWRKPRRLLAAAALTVAGIAGLSSLV